MSKDDDKPGSKRDPRSHKEWVRTVRNIAPRDPGLAARAVIHGAAHRAGQGAAALRELPASHLGLRTAAAELLIAGSLVAGSLGRAGERVPYAASPIPDRVPVNVRPSERPTPPKMEDAPTSVSERTTVPVDSQAATRVPPELQPGLQKTADGKEIYNVYITPSQFVKDFLKNDATDEEPKYYRTGIVIDPSGQVIFENYYNEADVPAGYRTLFNGSFGTGRLDIDQTNFIFVPDSNPDPELTIANAILQGKRFVYASKNDDRASLLAFKSICAAVDTAKRIEAQLIGDTAYSDKDFRASLQAAVLNGYHAVKLEYTHHDLRSPSFSYEANTMGRLNGLSSTLTKLSERAEFDRGTSRNIDLRNLHSAPGSYTPLKTTLGMLEQIVDFGIHTAPIIESRTSARSAQR
jgi:hypothetical protein